MRFLPPRVRPLELRRERSASGCRIGAGLRQQEEKAAARPAHLGEGRIREPTSLARQGDSSLHAEVGLPASAVPPAVPAAEGQLLGFGS